MLQCRTDATIPLFCLPRLFGLKRKYKKMTGFSLTCGLSQGRDAIIERSCGTTPTNTQVARYRRKMTRRSKTILNASLGGL
jgi:hypothetical protein